MKNIDQLLKKGKGKLTGDEVGRLMIADLIECYKNALAGGDVNTGILTDKEKTQLVNDLEGSENIKRYNKYRYLNDFLTRFPTMNALQEQIFDNYYFRLYSLLKTAQNAEDEYYFDNFRPLILTEDKYRELTAEQNARDREQTYTAIDLIFEYIEELLYKYENGKRIYSGVKKALKASESQPITNKRIKKYYYDKGEHGHYETPEGLTEKEVIPAVWQELALSDSLVFIEEREAPEDITAYEILEDVSAWYNPEPNRGDYNETPNNNMLEELKADYPAIFSYVWEIMTKEPALEPIKEMTSEELISVPFITGLELANAGILDFKKRISEDYRPENIKGIAILKSGTYNPETDIIDRMPHYHFLSEHLLEGDTKDAIEIYIETLNNCLVELYSYTTAIQIIGEKLDIKGLELFYSDMQDRQDRIAILNDTFKTLIDGIQRNGKTPNEKPAEELKAELKELLKPISVTRAKPSEELIKGFKDAFNLDTLEGKGLAYTSDIAQAIRDAIEGV